MLLGKRLKELRTNKKMTQEDLGKRINVTKVSISGYENGNRTPDTETLQKIADTFDVSTDYLMGRTNNPDPNKDEKDIAKRIEAFKRDLANSDGLNFSGEPMSEDAKESLIEAMDHIFRQTQRINKKFIPKKHRNNED